jgi:hypothetical protein
MKTLSFVTSFLFLAATFFLSLVEGADVEQTKSSTKARPVQESKVPSSSMGHAKPAIANTVNRYGNEQNQKHPGDSGPIASTATVSVSKSDLISAAIDNRPLNEIVQLLSEKRLFDLRGTIPSGETISVNFSDLTLVEALKKIMRGYNYVLLNQSYGQKPVLMVMGRAERAKPSDIVAIAIPVQPPDQAMDPKSSYVPPNTLLDKAPVGKSMPPAGSSPENQPRPIPTPIGIPVTTRGPQPVQTVDSETSKKTSDASNERQPASSGLQENRPHQLDNQDDRGINLPGTTSTEKLQ